MSQSKGKWLFNNTLWSDFWLSKWLLKLKCNEKAYSQYCTKDFEISNVSSLVSYAAMLVVLATHYFKE